MAVFETVRDQFGNIGSGYIMNRQICDPRIGKFTSENIGKIFRIAVHGSVGDHHAFDFRTVRTPDVIFLQQISEIVSPDRSVERADNPDIQCGSFLEDVLHLHAVFADDIRIITAGIIQPVAVKIHFVIEDRAV